MEYKSAIGELKAINGQDEGAYEGYFAIIGNVDDGGDRINRGAFGRTLAERANRIKVFFCHDWSKPIGPPPDILREDATGLYAKGRLTLESFYGREAWALIKDNALAEGSIGYEPVEFDYSMVDGKPVRELKAVQLYEISPVPLGMNPLAGISASKSLFGGMQAQDILSLVAYASQEVKAGRLLSAETLGDIDRVIEVLRNAGLALDELKVASQPKEAPKTDEELVKTQARMQGIKEALAKRGISV